MIKLVAINERGRRIGEGHNMAKLTDHDVDLVLNLLEEREKIIRSLTKYGLARCEIDQVLATAQLSYKGIGDKFEVTKQCIWRISMCKTRGQYPARWKRVEQPA
jgi:hypothetical protein